MKDRVWLTGRDISIVIASVLSETVKTVRNILGEDEAKLFERLFTSMAGEMDDRLAMIERIRVKEHLDEQGHTDWTNNKIN
jgi:hypothetical protein